MSPSKDATHEHTTFFHSCTWDKTWKLHTNIPCSFIHEPTCSLGALCQGCFILGVLWPAFLGEWWGGGEGGARIFYWLSSLLSRHFNFWTCIALHGCVGIVMGRVMVTQSRISGDVTCRLMTSKVVQRAYNPLHTCTHIYVLGSERITVHCN